MRALKVLLPAVLAILVLASCGNMAVEDMLSAPALTDDQSAVIAALEAYSSEKTVLKYPASGEWKAPIQFIDLDADGENEAVVFFIIRAEGVYTKIAVMKKTDGIWKVVSEIEGQGTDVESVSAIELGRRKGPRYLLVEWSSASSGDVRLAVYSFLDEQLSLGFEESATDTLIYDFDSDGLEDFCYVSRLSGPDGFRIKYVRNTPDGLVDAGEFDLNDEMVATVNLIAGSLESGRIAVFVDESITENMYVTEVFTFNKGNMYRADIGQEYNILDISLRSAPLTSLYLSNSHSVLIPSGKTPKNAIGADDRYIYWYGISSDGLTHELTTLFYENLGINIAVPDGWIETVSVVGEDEPGVISFIVSDTREEIFSVKELTVGEDAKPIILEGYAHFLTAGAHRYYYKAFCDESDLEYILDNSFAF